MAEHGQDADTLASKSLLGHEPSDYYGTISERTPASNQPDGDDQTQADTVIITEELSTARLAIILGSTYLGIILAALDGTM
ncbi:MAG: hypothetical protein Q9204_009050, partial [Flavoplaca sp. TL-2023a]